MSAQTTAKTQSRQPELNLEPIRTTGQAATLTSADIVLLARLADGKAVARPDVSRDCAALVTAIEPQLAQLSAAGLITDSAGRLSLTPAGRDALMVSLALKSLPKTWSDTRTVLVAQSLGLKLDAARQQLLAKPDGLRAVILDQRFDLRLKGALTNTRIRQALAVLALERAFGNKVKAGLGTGSGLNPKAGRVLAGQLAKMPRDFGTDARLIAALAAEQVGASSTEFEALRTALIARLTGATASAPQQKSSKIKAAPVGPAVAAPTPPANDLSPALPPMPLVPAAAMPANTVDLSSRPAASNRPDLVGFAAAVQLIAKQRAEGWSGSRKSYIADVWDGVKSRFTSWGLTEVEFKGMLAEAHRTGHVVLATADLKTKDNAARLSASAINYKNTVWHFVRVED
jgi:hypothetical protein